MKAKLIAGGIIVVLLLLLVPLGTRYFLASPRGRVEAAQQVESGPFRLAAYEQFFALCSAVQTDEHRIANLSNEARTATDARKNQIAASITAIRNSRADKINTYNIRARQEATVGQFRDAGLPATLNEGTETTCINDG